MSVLSFYDLRSYSLQFAPNCINEWQNFIFDKSHVMSAVADNCACSIGRLLRDPPTCALPIDPSVVLCYWPIAQIAQMRATLALLIHLKHSWISSWVTNRFIKNCQKAYVRISIIPDICRQRICSRFSIHFLVDSCPTSLTGLE